MAERGFRGLRLVWVTILALLLNYLIFRHVLIYYFTGRDSFYALVLLILFTSEICLLYSLFVPKPRIDPLSGMSLGSKIFSFLTIIFKALLCFLGLISGSLVIFPIYYGFNFKGSEDFVIVKLLGFVDHSFMTWVVVWPAVVFSPIYSSLEGVLGWVGAVAIVLGALLLIVGVIYLTLGRLFLFRPLVRFTLWFIVIFSVTFWVGVFFWHFRAFSYLIMYSHQSFYDELYRLISIIFMYSLWSILGLLAIELSRVLMFNKDFSRDIWPEHGFKLKGLTALFTAAILCVALFFILIDFMGPRFYTIEIGDLSSAWPSYVVWLRIGDDLYTYRRDLKGVSRWVKFPLPAGTKIKKIIPIKSYPYSDGSIELVTKSGERYLLNIMLLRRSKRTVYRFIPLPPELNELVLIFNTSTLVGRDCSGIGFKHLYYLVPLTKAEEFYCGSGKGCTSKVRIDTLFSLAPVATIGLERYRVKSPIFKDQSILAPRGAKISVERNSLKLSWDDPQLSDKKKAELLLYWGDKVKTELPTVNGRVYWVWNRSYSPIIGVKLQGQDNTYIYGEMRKVDDMVDLDPSSTWLAVCKASKMEVCNAVVGSFALVNLREPYEILSCDGILYLWHKMCKR